MDAKIEKISYSSTLFRTTIPRQVWFILNGHVCWGRFIPASHFSRSPFSVYIHRPKYHQTSVLKLSSSNSSYQVVSTLFWRNSGWTSIRNRKTSSRSMHESGKTLGYACSLRKIFSWFWHWMYLWRIYTKKMTKKFHFTRGFLRKYSLEQRKKETLGKKYNLFPHFLILNGGQNGDFLIYVLLRLANTRIR